MAKRNSKERLTPKPERPEQQQVVEPDVPKGKEIPTASNESPSVSPKDWSLQDVAVPSQKGLNELVSNRTTLVSSYSRELTLEDCQRLMSQVKLSQANLTETLNSLSKYRKTVASLLEQKRRQQAAERKQANQSSVKETSDLDKSSLEISDISEDSNQIGS